MINFQFNKKETCVLNYLFICISLCYNILKKKKPCDCTDVLKTSRFKGKTSEFLSSYWQIFKNSDFLGLFFWETCQNKITFAVFLGATVECHPAALSPRQIRPGGLLATLSWFWSLVCNSSVRGCWAEQQRLCCFNGGASPAEVFTYGTYETIGPVWSPTLYP